MGEPQVGEWTPQDLINRIELGEALQILDVRAAFRLADGAIDLVPKERFFNRKGSEVLGMSDPREAGLVDGIPVAVVCGLGNDSRRIAQHLAGFGLEAVSMQGGMAAWMRLIVRRELRAPAAIDRIIQFDRVGKGALGYALVSDGEAVLVDVPRLTAPFLEAVASVGAQVVGIADTHAHADYISGGPALATRLDVPYFLHPADAVLPFDGREGTVSYRAIYEGTPISFGRTALQVLHTPGHTEGSVCFRLEDDLALTGDLVFIGSVGRPDLGGKQAEWTRTLWQSLERVRHEWPPGLDVLPAHYAGGHERNADFTVGREFGLLARHNEALAIDDEEAFATWVRTRTGKFPEAYRRIKAINLGLDSVDDAEADELEAGKNQCALG